MKKNVVYYDTMGTNWCIIGVNVKRLQKRYCQPIRLENLWDNLSLPLVSLSYLSIYR